MPLISKERWNTLGRKQMLTCIYLDPLITEDGQCETEISRGYGGQERLRDRETSIAYIKQHLYGTSETPLVLHVAG